MSDIQITNAEAIQALTTLRVYAASNTLEALDYAMAVLKKLDDAGIKTPLETLKPQEK